MAERFKAAVSHNSQPLRFSKFHLQYFLLFFNVQLQYSALFCIRFKKRERWKVRYGHSQDLTLRLVKHNSGKVHATKNRRPLILHYFEEFSAKTEANRRELFFKTIEGYKYLKARGII